MPVSRSALNDFGMTIIEPSEFDYEAWNGKLLIWEAPEAGECYAIGVDPAEGVGSDNSVAEVIKIGNLRHPDVQVAEFACNYLDPVDFGGVVRHLGRFYSGPDREDAFLTLECNAPCGDTMMADLYHRHDYTNVFIWKAYDRRQNIYTSKLGWWTNKSTRPKLIARGIHALTYGDLVVNSDYLLQEMMDFQRDPLLSKARAMAGKHDDRIMALLMAYWGAHDEEFLAGEDIGEQRRLQEALARRAPETPDIGLPVGLAPVRRADYQSRPISFSKMWAEADAELLREDPDR